MHSTGHVIGSHLLLNGPLREGVTKVRQASDAASSWAPSRNDSLLRSYSTGCIMVGTSTHNSKMCSSFAARMGQDKSLRNVLKSTSVTLGTCKPDPRSDYSKNFPLYSREEQRSSYGSQDPAVTEDLKSVHFTFGDNHCDTRAFRRYDTDASVMARSTWGPKRNGNDRFFEKKTTTYSDLGSLQADMLRNRRSLALSHQNSSLPTSPGTSPSHGPPEPLSPLSPKSPFSPTSTGTNWAGNMRPKRNF
mmetsp:Transcript_1152/g.2552  ORF Transcript_1152/g.2552 Transcript_1152/m.2552 type:complete len:247 (+) Transcript_1152:217-957(+)